MMSDLSAVVQPNIPANMQPVPIREHCQNIEAIWTKQPSGNDNNIPMRMVLNLPEFLTHLDGQSLISLRSAVKMNRTDSGNFYTNFDHKFTFNLNLNSVNSLSEGGDILYRSFKMDAASCTVQTFEMLIEKKAHIQGLDLYGCRNLSVAIEDLTDESLEQIFSHCESLNLKFTGMTVSAVKKLLPHLGMIKKFNLHQCTNLSAAIENLADEVLERIFSNCEELSLRQTEITVSALQKLLPHLGAIKSLDLYQCKNFPAAIEALTDEVLERIFGDCEILTLSRIFMTALAFQKLLRHLRAIKALDLEWYGDRDLSAFLEALPDEQLQRIFGHCKIVFSGVPDDIFARLSRFTKVVR
jgi:hypothetical protein